LAKRFPDNFPIGQAVSYLDQNQIEELCGNSRRWCLRPALGCVFTPLLNASSSCCHLLVLSEALQNGIYSVRPVAVRE
jgi:hypothetical protein